MDCKSKRSFRQPWLYLIALTALTSALVNTPLKAQIPPLQVPAPQDIQPFPTPIPSPELPQPLPPPEELLEPTLPAPTTPESIPAGLQTINVERFEVVGSTVFPADNLRKFFLPLPIDQFPLLNYSVRVRRSRNFTLTMVILLLAHIFLPKPCKAK